MKRILIPTDFSKYADQAIEAGAQIAKKNNAEIVLIHMLELPGQSNDAVTGETSIPAIMLFKQKADEILKSIKDRPYLKGIPITEVILLDNVYKGIATYANKNDIDLIVMGSHGSSGFEEIFIGTNTEKVVRLSNIPVLIIKQEVDQLDIKKIVFASDFSKEIKKPFLELLKFAKIFNAKLKLVMICTPNSFKSTTAAEKIMKEFVAEFDMPDYSMETYNDTNIEKGIINYANAKNADLIALCTHGRTALTHFFSGSISEDLVNHTSRPVVTFKI
ncbi:universal stress protein [Flavobacterium laiguense]|uniref:Universal stress protein UspA n=1 Tax=Flavobacterium laiguense TaxID=2169409 RepID=A0A2U1JYZ6_9FLAO|nr:universal stress protein [Flavobacterium laiguense]PWA10174.1 universal stress protein UspA [Flavobacterium laiguense]